MSIVANVACPVECATTRTYDARGRVLTKTVPQFGMTTYVYDQNGTQNERMTDSAGNLTTKTYDKLGRLETVTSLGGKTTYAYDTAGRTQTITNPNGTTERYTYDKNNQLTTLENRQGETVTDRYVYTYDDAGNQLTKTETVNGVENATASFAYDVLNRLSTAEERDGKRYAYEYDASGNRTSTTVRDRATNAVVNSESYSYDARNRIEMYMDASGMPRSFSYDANGNVTEDQNGGYVYDAFSRLTTHVKFISGGTEETHYAYNGDGQRTSKTDSNNVSTYYQYEYDKVVLEQKSTGEVTRNTYGLNLISRSTGKVQEKSLNANMSVKVSYNETLYYQYNGHADVTRLSDASGIEKASYTYDAFGNTLESTGTENNPYRYAGYTYDEESSLYYLNARYYNPKTARFQSQDTYLGDQTDPLSLNLYTYCSNNPVRYFDPSGHFTVDDMTEKEKKEFDYWIDIVVNGKTSEERTVAMTKATEIMNSAKIRNAEEDNQEPKSVWSKDYPTDTYLETKLDLAYDGATREFDPDKIETYSMIDEIAYKNGGTVTQNPDGTVTVSINGKETIFSTDGRPGTVQMQQVDLKNEKNEVYDTTWVIKSTTLQSLFGLTGAESRHNDGDLFSSMDRTALAFGLTYNELSIASDTEIGAKIYQDNNSGKFLFDNVQPGTATGVMNTGFDTKNGTRTGVALVHTHADYTGPSDYDTDDLSGRNSDGEGDLVSANCAGVPNYVITPGGYMKKVYPYHIPNDPYPGPDDGLYKWVKGGKYVYRIPDENMVEVASNLPTKSSVQLEPKEKR